MERTSTTHVVLVRNIVTVYHDSAPEIVSTTLVTILNFSPSLETMLIDRVYSYMSTDLGLGFESQL